MHNVIGLTPISIESIIFYLKKHLITDEPIDSFEFCNFSKLDSSLKTPFQRPFCATFHSDLIEKTSLTFFLLIENHILPTNGNKRLATMSLLVMLDINGAECTATNDELYQLAVYVAQAQKNNIKVPVIIKNIQEILTKKVQLKPLSSDDKEHAFLTLMFNFYQEHEDIIYQYLEQKYKRITR